MTPSEAWRLDRPALHALQLRKLDALLEAVSAGNRFYRSRLPAPRVDSLAAFTASFPFTFKQELVDDQLAHPPYGTNLSYHLQRYTRFHQTSGTTGAPLRVLDTPESWNAMLDCWTRKFETTGATAHDRVFFPFSFGPFLGFWVAFEAAARMGCLAIPGGGMRSAARIRAILDNDVTILCATPTYAIRLAEVAAEERIDLSASKVRRIIVAGEPGGGIPATRSLIERLWPGARVADHHGMTETGPVSYECPERPMVLHIMESAFLPEVLDPATLQPVLPGETGELVLTTLDRIGSPLLRYRTRDLVRRSLQERCPCGTHELALEGGILGRTDDMVVVRGVNVYPSAVEEVLRSIEGIAEYRVHIRTGQALPEMQVEVEPVPGFDAAYLTTVCSSALQNTFALRVSVITASALPRFEAKARRWILGQSPAGAERS